MIGLKHAAEIAQKAVKHAEERIIKGYTEELDTIGTLRCCSVDM